MVTVLDHCLFPPIPRAAHHAVYQLSLAWNDPNLDRKAYLYDLVIAVQRLLAVRLFRGVTTPALGATWERYKLVRAGVGVGAGVRGSEGGGSEGARLRSASGHEVQASGSDQRLG